MPDVAGIDIERAWKATVLATVVGLVGGVTLFPRTVWDGFLWRYLWGPVYADAHNVACATIEGGTPAQIASRTECAALERTGAIVAEPGYTLVSEVVYALTLLFALAGVYFLLQRLDVGTGPQFVYGLLPFVFFGGALRVVEDALDAAAGSAGSIPIEYPLNTPLISPFIYFTVFFVTLASLLSSLWAADRGIVERYETGLAVVGSVVLALTLGYLGFLAATTEFVSFHPQILVVVLAGAGLLTGLTWVGIERYRPEINAGTGAVGLVVLFAHAVDGVANVVGIDWGAELGLPYGDLSPKHPVNDAMIGLGSWLSEVVADLTAGGLFTDYLGGPVVLADLIGSAWPFLLLKLAVATAVVWLFDEAIIRESPRYALLLLLAIVAVGLGPGTRDMLRATFGI